MIVFLDISGPLLTERSALQSRINKANFLQFNGPSAKRIADCLRKSKDTLVVVSSNFALEGEAVIKQWLALNDMHLNYHQDWTSCTTMGAPRHQDILGWLENHPEELEYVIIDDIKMPEGILYQKQVHVKDSEGFSEDNQRELVKQLGLI